MNTVENKEVDKTGEFHSLRSSCIFFPFCFASNRPEGRLKANYLINNYWEKSINNVTSDESVVMLTISSENSPFQITTTLLFLQNKQGTSNNSIETTFNQPGSCTL